MTEPTTPVPFETRQVGDETRYRYNVCAIKLPYRDRDVARVVMPTDNAAENRGFRPGLGGDTPDDHHRFPASSRDTVEAARQARDDGHPEPWRMLDGARVWYTLMLTEAEAAQHRAASNCRAVTVDSTHWPI